jgi:hypothetical protein
VKKVKQNHVADLLANQASFEKNYRMNFVVKPVFRVHHKLIESFLVFSH